MNMNDSPLPDQLGALLAVQDDDAGSHFLWVDITGEVHISHMEEAVQDDVRLLYAPFEAGVGLVGEDAATDPELLQDLLSSLITQWRTAEAAPPGVIMIDLDDPESSADWTMTDIAVVDEALLTSMKKGLR